MGIRNCARKKEAWRKKHDSKFVYKIKLYDFDTKKILKNFSYE